MTNKEAYKIGDELKEQIETNIVPVIEKFCHKYKDAPLDIKFNVDLLITIKNEQGTPQQR